MIHLPTELWILIVGRLDDLFASMNAMIMLEFTCKRFKDFGLKSFNDRKAFNIFHISVTAANLGYLNILKWIHAKNIRINLTESLMDASDNGHFEIVKFLIQNYNLETLNKYKMWPLGEPHGSVVEYHSKKFPEMRQWLLENCPLLMTDLYKN